MISIGTASANSMQSDLRCTLRVYFDNVTLASQKLCQHNNKFDCSETNGCNTPQDAINEVYVIEKKKTLTSFILLIKRFG